jgi:three-Cys-motif partner protein
MVSPRGHRVARSRGLGHGPLPKLEDDGLSAPEIGKWGEDKYRLVANYAQLFAQSMRQKWDTLIYVDLFAGSGRSRIRGTTRIVPASPLLVLRNPASFSRYIFCEMNREKADALRSRVQAAQTDRDVRIIVGDANACVADILRAIPADGTLCFCFADPFALSNLHFETIRGLSKRRADHLILIPTGMDANRNIDQHYSKETNRILDDFLGDDHWRPAWKAARSQRLSADLFLLREFNGRMRSMEYLEPETDQTHLIQSDEKNSPSTDWHSTVATRWRRSSGPRRASTAPLNFPCFPEVPTLRRQPERDRNGCTGSLERERRKRAVATPQPWSGSPGRRARNACAPRRASGSSSAGRERISGGTAHEPCS